MARELHAQHVTGATLYAVLLDASGQPWNGSVFDTTPTAGEWGNYDIAMVEDSTTGYYVGTFPGSQAAGAYSYRVHKQLAGAPAVSDPVIWTGEGYWNGSAWIVPLEPVTPGRKLAVDAENQAEADVKQVEGTDATDYFATLDDAVLAAITAATSPLATSAALAAVSAFVDTEVAAILAAVDTEVAAIKAKTDNLPTDPADQSAVEAAITAAVSGLATAAKLLSYVQSLARKNVTADADIGGTFSSATDSLEAIRDRGDTAWGGGGSTAGSGAIEFTYTVTSLGDPVDGVEVWVTTDEAGSDVVAGTLVTDAFGIVVFMLDAGDYFFWQQKAGYNFTNPEPQTVS